MEFPPRITVPVACRAMNRESARRWSISPDPRPALGERPNPGRSSARTRPRPERPGATWTSSGANRRARGPARTWSWTVHPIPGTRRGRPDRRSVARAASIVTSLRLPVPHAPRTRQAEALERCSVAGQWEPPTGSRRTFDEERFRGSIPGPETLEPSGTTPGSTWGDRRWIERSPFALHEPAVRQGSSQDLHRSRALQTRRRPLTMQMSGCQGVFSARPDSLAALVPAPETTEEPEFPRTCDVASCDRAASRRRVIRSAGASASPRDRRRRRPAPLPRGGGARAAAHQGGRGRARHDHRGGQGGRGAPPRRPSAVREEHRQGAPRRARRPRPPASGSSWPTFDWWCPWPASTRARACRCST